MVNSYCPFPALRRRTTLTRWLATVTLVAASSFANAQTQAQTASQASLERQTEEAFRQVLQRPADVDQLMRYIELLIQAENFEGGIAAMERLLLDPTAPPRIRLELGAMYLRLKSFAMASVVLQDAIRIGGLTPAELQTAQSLLREASRRSERSIFGGFANFGVRRQSNPTFVTDSSTIYSANALVANTGARRRADTDLFASARLNHEFDLELGGYASIVSSLGVYASNFRSSSGSSLRLGNTNPSDLFVFDGNSGLQLRPIEGNDRFSIRPHVLFSSVIVQQHRFMSSVGVGVDGRHELSDRTSYTFALDTQRRDFVTRVDAPTADQFDGRATGVRTGLLHAFDGGHSVSADLGLRRTTAGRSYYEYDTFDGRVAYSLSYAGPVGGSRWTTTASVGFSNRDYRGADPAVLSTTVREDREKRFGLNQIIPLTDQWLLQFAYDRSRNRSNLPNYGFTNNAVSASVLRSF